MNPLIFSIPNVCHCEKVHKSHPPSSQGPWDSWALNHGRSKALTSCAKVKLGQEFAGLNFLNRGTPISEWEWWPNNYGNKKGVETNFWKGTDGVFWTIFFLPHPHSEFSHARENSPCTTVFHDLFCPPRFILSSHHSPGRANPVTLSALPRWDLTRNRLSKALENAKMVIQESMDTISSDVATFWRTKNKNVCESATTTVIFVWWLLMLLQIIATNHSGWCSPL